MSTIHPISLPPALLIALVLAPASRAGDALAPTALVSATPSGQLQSGFARDPRISADGRYVVFWSDAADLVPGDVNGTYDVFLRDTWTGTTELISVSASGGPCDGPSIQPGISADGRFVSFDSGSTNLLSPPAFGTFSTYVRDRLSGTTELASRATGPNGAQANNTTELSAISGDGRWVAFCSYADNLTPSKTITNGFRDVYLRDRLTHTTTLVSHGPGGVLANSSSWRASLSHDGARVAFHAQASNLVAGGTTAGRLHVYLYERALDLVTLQSVAAGGVEGDADSYDARISGGGGFLVFDTAATNLVTAPPGPSLAVLRDLATGTFDPFHLDSSGQPLTAGARDPSLSADGRYVVFSSNGGMPQASGQLTVRDRAAGKTFAVCSTDAGDGQFSGAGFDPQISADGTTVAFGGSGNLVGGIGAGEAVYVRGIGAPLTYCIAKTGSFGCQPRIGSSGEARVGNGFDLTVSASQALNQTIGILVHGVAGPAQIPFAGGLLCVAPPFFRSQVAQSGGAPPPVSDCSGQWSLHLGAVLASSPLGASVGAGSVLMLQWWGRDPIAAPPGNAQLSDALQVFVAP